MRIAPVLISFPFIIAACAAPLKEFYPDSYFSEDGIYQNKPIGFMLVFRGNWHIATQPDNMERGSRSFARQLQQASAELLFVGTTAEKTQGVRGIAINLNMACDKYAEKIRNLNKADVKEDLGITPMVLNNMPMVRWDYTIEHYRFVEFFFTLYTYNLRIAFWSKPDIFERFEPVYLDIISSMSFVARI